MANELPLISVVTVAYNDVEYLKKNIESVLAQGYPNVQHIVIDGGSTDGTVELLKQYDHLEWVSESDRGQSHALNKGFARARGEIIAWLNSDDSYPEGVFFEVEKGLRENQVVMGHCEVLYDDRTEIDENQPHSWFDFFKYWVYHSSPSQPSVFFRRELLERAKRPNGDYVDEDLYYCMDLDLWLRMSRWAPFEAHIPKVLSHFPKYEESKTGGAWEPVWKEMSRVFRRHERVAFEVECELSVIIPMHSVSAEVHHSLRTVVEQDVVDTEVLFVDCAAEAEDSAQIKKLAQELEGKLGSVAVRYVSSTERIPAKVFSDALSSARGRLVTCLPAGAKLDSNVLSHAITQFGESSLALLGLYRTCSDLLPQLLADVNGQSVFQVQGLFVTHFLPPLFIARRAALLDLVDLKPEQSDFAYMKLLCASLRFKGWQVHFTHELGMETPESAWGNAHEMQAIFFNYVNAQIIDSLSKAMNAAPFAKVRAKHGFSVVLPDEYVAAAQKFLSFGPEDFYSVAREQDPRVLENILEDYSQFGPGWYVLSQVHKHAGRQAEADTAYATHERCKSVEGQF